MQENSPQIASSNASQIKTYSGIEELADAEKGLNNYYRQIVKKVLEDQFQKIKKNNEFSILEFGAGTGYLAELTHLISGIKPDCLEIDEYLISVIQSKDLNCFKKLDKVNKEYDLIYTSNVLEHIETDQESISELRKLLKPEGHLVIYVPAFMLLFSDLDRSVGHFRRYSKKELVSKVQAAGLQVVKVSYMDSVGFFASILIRIVGYKGRGNLGGLKSMRFFDKYLFPISTALDNAGVKKIFGKNLLLVAKLEELK